MRDSDPSDAIDGGNWLSEGLAVRDALSSGSWRETAQSSTEWLLARSKVVNLSVQTLRRSAAAAGFAKRLTEIGALATPEDAGKLSMAKLELVEKIWELSPVKAAEAARQMISQSAGGPTLRGLRKLYDELLTTTDKTLEARKTGRKSAQSKVMQVLREISRLNTLIGDGRAVATPQGKSLPYVIIDGIIVRPKDGHYEAEEAIIVIRSQEIINRATLLPLLAQCFWVSTFFNRLWVAGRTHDFPIGFAPDTEASGTNEIDTFIAHIRKCGGTNIGILEITDKEPKIILEPVDGPVPDRRLTMKRTLRLDPSQIITGELVDS